MLLDSQPALLSSWWFDPSLARLIALALPRNSSSVDDAVFTSAGHEVNSTVYHATANLTIVRDAHNCAIFCALGKFVALSWGADCKAFCSVIACVPSLIMRNSRSGVHLVRLGREVFERSRQTWPRGPCYSREGRVQGFTNLCWPEVTPGPANFWI